MAQSEYRLHFARLLRPQTFGEVVGQDVSLQLLANSVQRNIAFPVYLLSGMRGSGKTTVGRLFAAALNCARLDEYRLGKVAWKELPCGSCQSCLLMARGEHPDFLEVDAASYTGVDHVRQIMDEAQFLPVLGNKKIYLIDEAHMLSKAAFNAFLKMLEEPPLSIVFLLATTEAHKIIETVQSRSFQLFFDPISFDRLAEYIVSIAQRRQISCSQAAAHLLARRSQGSVRDALMAFEQAWLHEPVITEESVRSLFDLVTYEVIFDVYRALAVSDIQLLETISHSLCTSSRALDHAWSLLVAIATAGMWFEAGGSLPEHFRDFEKDFNQLLSIQPTQSFSRYLDVFFRYESLLAKTTQPECLFYRMVFACVSSDVAPMAGVSSRSVDKTINAKTTRKTLGNASAEQVVNSSLKHDVFEEKTRSTTIPASVCLTQFEQDLQQKWTSFVARVSGECADPVLVSVFSAGRVVSVVDGVVQVSFPKSFTFYQELLVRVRPQWQGCFELIFGNNVTLVPRFEDSLCDTAVLAKKKNDVSVLQASGVKNDTGAVGCGREKEKSGLGRTSGSMDFTDTEQWPIANKLLRIMPGSISEYEE